MGQGEIHEAVEDLHSFHHGQGPEPADFCLDGLLLSIVSNCWHHAHIISTRQAHVYGYAGISRGLRLAMLAFHQMGVPLFHP